MDDPMGEDDSPPPTPLSRSDMVAVRSALKAGRWPIADVARRRLVAQCMSILRNPLAPDRSKLAAGKLLSELDRLNMEQEKRDAGIPDRHEMTVRVEYVDHAPAAEAT